MRDIRDDLRERLSAIDGRMSELVREYNREKEALDKRFSDSEKLLDQERNATSSMLQVEQLRFGDDSAVSNPPQLADFLISQVEARPGIPKEELRRLAVEGGYFSDGEASGRSVHFTLMNLVKAKRLTAVGDNNYRLPRPNDAMSGLTLLGQGLAS